MSSRHLCLQVPRPTASFIIRPGLGGIVCVISSATRKSVGAALLAFYSSFPLDGSV